MTKAGSNSKPGSSNKGFWLAFWLTIIVLAGLYVAATLKKERLIVDQATGQVSISELYVSEWQQHVLPGYLNDLDIEIRKAQGDIEKVIDRRLNDAFAPVYRQIPKVADFHYSVTGEYLELLAAGSGEVGKDINRLLFEETNFTARLEQAMSHIYDDNTSIIARTLDNLRKKLQEHAGFNIDDMRLVGKVATLSLSDAESRFTSGFNAIRGAGSLVGVGATAAILTKTVGKKVAGKLVVKLGGKTAAKATGLGSGAATGAAMGSVLGPIGTVVGGVVGGVAFWLATDKLIVEVDEHLNRDEFIADITTLIDAEKLRIRNQLLGLYNDHLLAISEQNKQDLKNIKTITTRELIEGKGSRPSLIPQPEPDVVNEK